MARLPAHYYTILPILAGWFLPLVRAWSFSAVPSGQCGPLTVTWSGGTAPFTVGIHPLNGTGQTTNVPDSAYKANQGSLEITLQVPQGGQYVVTMGDANGVLTGGASQILTAGAQAAGISNCNTTYATPDFFWSANAEDNLKQCQTYPFTDIGTDPNAKIQRPVTLLVIIPNGSDSFSVQIPNASSFAWTANVAKDTKVVFDLVDSQGHQGGVVEALRTVQAGDTSCKIHNANDGASSTGNPNATGTSQPSSSSGGISTGAIAGIAVGCAALAVIAAVLIFFLCRRRRRRNGGNAGVDLLGGPSANYTDQDHTLPPGSIPQPYYDSNRMSQISSSVAPSSVGPTKSTLPSNSPAFIQHSDIEETGPVELPPQYSAARQPLLTADGQWMGGSGSGSSSYSSPGPSDVTSTAGSPAGNATGESHRSNSMRKGPR